MTTVTVSVMANELAFQPCCVTRPADLTFLVDFEDPASLAGKGWQTSCCC